MTHFALTLPNGHTADARANATGFDLLLKQEVIAQLQHTPLGPTHSLLQGGLPLEPHPHALLPLLAELFCRNAALREVTLELACSREFALAAVRHGVAYRMQPQATGWQLLVDYQSFWQQPALWLTAPSSAGLPLRYTFTGEKRHPLRAPKPQDVVYRRYLPELDSTITLRVADLARDLDAFHDWMNQDRVHRFWELAGDRESHAAYLQAQLDDAKVLPLIAEFDGEAFAYLETYWAKEDRLSPFFDVQDYDRGCHVLVGNSRHRGPAKVAVWMRSMSHYLFLDDPRTQRVVGEPRVDNLKFIAYLQSQGFAKLKEFHFPHKRAAMVVLEREAFFEQYGPGSAQ